MGKITLLIAHLLLFCCSVAGAQPSPPAAKAAPEATAGAAVVKEDQVTNFTIESALSVRDPFRRPILEGGEGNINLIPDIERYELDKMKLVGVITGPRKSKAMITVPSGKMVLVEESTHIGNRHGVIKKILPGMIAVEEKVVNLLGQEESIETVLEYNATKDKKQ